MFCFIIEHFAFITAKYIIYALFDIKITKKNNNNFRKSLCFYVYVHMTGKIWLQQNLPSTCKTTIGNF